MPAQYVYLLQEREFINMDKKIYKIGKTEQENGKRFMNYPKGSMVLFQIICDNCHELEKNIIELFTKKYIRCKNIGNEYFEGDYNDMIESIYNLRNKKYEYNDIPNNNINIQNIKIINIKDEKERKIMIKLEENERNKLLNLLKKDVKNEFNKIMRMEKKEKKNIKEHREKMVSTPSVFLNYLEEITEKTEDETKFITMNKLHEKFKISDYYINSSCDDKRGILAISKMKYFFQKNKSTMLKYKADYDKTTENGRIRAKSVLVGYKFKNTE